MLRYDSLAEQHGIYKLETVGDAYLAGQAEPPLTHENHPPSVVSFGLKMVEAVRQWSAGSGVVIGVRVGVHTGREIEKTNENNHLQRMYMAYSI